MKRKRLLLYSIVVLVTLTIWAAPKSAKTIKQNQVAAAVALQASPQAQVTESSELFGLLDKSVAYQAKRTPYGGTSTGGYVVLRRQKGLCGSEEEW